MAKKKEIITKNKNKSAMLRVTRKIQDFKYVKYFHKIIEMIL